MNTAEPAAHAATPPAAGGGARPDADRLALDQPTPERGLATLVLTVVELLRQLVERQAIRRMDRGDLDADQVERVGATLLALDDQMTSLREHFGLDREDLNLDLGPLGPLLPTD
jgi:hypothetical protein